MLVISLKHHDDAEWDLYYTLFYLVLAIRDGSSLCFVSVTSELGTGVLTLQFRKFLKIDTH